MALFLGTHVRLVAMREFLISTLVLASSAQQYPWNLEADYTTSTTAGFLPGFSDGALVNASFRRPAGIAIDPVLQELYVADKGNHAIRRVRVADQLAASAEASNASSVAERDAVEFGLSSDYVTPAAPLPATVVT